jgi:hypothetical protein
VDILRVLEDVMLCRVCVCEQIGIGECLLLFGAESFVFQIAIDKVIGQDI